jgi:glucokinase
VVEPVLVADIGGTHARFALADVDRNAPQLRYDTIKKFKAADYTTVDAAVRAYLATQGNVAPKRAALAVATAVASDVIHFTNSPWVFKQSALKLALGFDRLLVLNDFGAVAHAVQYLQSSDLISLTSPTDVLPTTGMISVIGAGTGLGVAAVLRTGQQSHILETEGGHIGFSPTDAVEIKIFEQLQKRYVRVSVERLVSGPGLVLLHEALAAIEGRLIIEGRSTTEGYPIIPRDDHRLWADAIDGSDAFARTTLERFCRLFGSVTGDIALAHGAKAVVIAGGLVPRFLDVLRGSDFLVRFRAKGRFESLMHTIPIFVCNHPNPGLLGAAAALNN